MFRLPPEWIYGRPYSVHTWMDATSVWYSLIPVPLIYLIFLMFVLSAYLAKDRQALIWFSAVALATQLLGVTICGYALTVSALLWIGFRFKHGWASGLARGAALGSLVILLLSFLWGFPRTVSFSSTVCQSTLKNLGTAVEMYQTDWDGQLPRDIWVLTPNYLKTIPSCPADPPGENSRTIKVTAEEYLVTCENGAHTAPELKVEPIRGRYQAHPPETFEQLR